MALPRAFPPPRGAAGWGIPPYVRFICCAHTGKTAARPPSAVGEGFIPPAGVRAAARFAGGACPALRAFQQRPAYPAGLPLPALFPRGPAAATVIIELRVESLE